MPLQSLGTPCSCSIRWTAGGFSQGILLRFCLWRGSSSFPWCSLFCVTVISPLLRAWDGTSVIASTSGTWGMLAGSLEPLLMLTYRLLEHELSTRPNRVCMASLRSLNPQVQCLPQGSQYSVFIGMGKRTICSVGFMKAICTGKRPSDSFPSANLGGTSQLECVLRF